MFRRLALSGATALFALLGATSVVAQEGVLAQIKNSGTIAIGHRESSVPFSYIGADQRPVGYSIDICLRIVDAVKSEIGVDTLSIKWVPVNPQTRIPLIANGTIQLECGSTTNTFTRQQQVDYSYTTFITGTKLLVKRGSGIQGVDDLNGKVIALAQGTTNERAVKEAIEARDLDVKVLNVKDHAEGFLALETDRVDAYSTDDILLFGLIQKAKSPEDYQVVGRFLSYDPYALMVPRNDSGFRLVVNRTLGGLFRSGDILAIYDRWFEPMGVPPNDLLLTSFATHAFPE
jgi:glutamate/aspartate transport system substrate-binding protein